jgi:hypothetical protein
MARDLERWAIQADAERIVKSNNANLMLRHIISLAPPQIIVVLIR